MGIEITVVKMMPSIRAPVTRRATRMVVTARPIRNVITTGFNDAECTIVRGSLTTNFALTNPIRLINSPMPHDTA